MYYILKNNIIEKELNKMNYTIPENLYTHRGNYSYSIKTIDECLTIFRKEKNSQEEEEEEVLNINSLLLPHEYF